MTRRILHPAASTRLALAVLALASLAAPPLARAQETALEAKVKAAYLVHLAKFVEWPNTSGNEMRICVIGSERVGDMMGQLPSRPLRDRTLRVEIGAIGDPTQCQVIYIGQAERRLPELVKRLRGHDVLTVSDQEDFARQGGIVGFYTESGRIKLEINPGAARNANLKISAKLLELARTVP